MKSPITTVEVKTIKLGTYETTNGAKIFLKAEGKNSIEFSTEEDHVGWWITHKDAFELSEFFKEIGVVLQNEEVKNNNACND